MKKLMKSFVILAVIAIAFGTASAVFAQGGAPGTPTGYTGTGTGYQGGRGGRGTGAAMLVQNRENNEDGLLHDLMIAAFAEALEMEVEDLEALLAEGKTLLEISGLTIDEFRTWMADIRTEVHEEAAAAGLLPGTQYGWQKDRTSTGRFGGMQGAGQGLYGSGDCLAD